MRIWLWLMIALLASAAVAIDTELAFEDAASQARYERLINEIRCVTCQNQSIRDSNAPLAADLRREVRERITAGESDADIYRFLQSRYGDFALYRPPMNARTYLLWFAPLLLLLIAGFTLFRLVRRRSSLDLSVDGE